MSNQGGVQQAIRDATGTELDYNGDWSALFDADGIPAGDWNGRLLAWLNGKLGTSHGGLPGAMQAFAEDQGAPNWNSLATLALGSSAGALLLETGDFILLESGGTLLLG